MMTSWLTPRRLGVLLAVGLCVHVTAAPLAAEAGAGKGPDNGWLKSMLGLPADSTLVVSDAELQSLGCVIGAAIISGAAVVFSGAAIIVTGGRNAASATKVAVPVLAAAAMAGCVTGNSASLGVAWLARNSENLVGKMVDAIPAEPLAKILPGAAGTP
jgi:hypothetical protein